MIAEGKFVRVFIVSLFFIYSERILSQRLRVAIINGQEKIFVRDRCLVVFFFFFSTWHVETMIDFYVSSCTYACMKLHTFDRTIRYVLYIYIYFFFFNLTLSITVKESRLACFPKMVIEMTMLFLLLMTK